MPTYVYEILDQEGRRAPAGPSRWVQSMKEDALTKHPETGEPVRRVPQAPMIAGNWSDSANKGKLSNQNLERHGLHEVREASGEGYMERVAGKGGPKTISAED
jgi:hypothetical protein